MRLSAIILAAALAATPAGAQQLGSTEGLSDQPVGPEGDIDCTHVEEIDRQREAENRGFDRIYASISTMTTASFCGMDDLSDAIDERIRKWIWAMDDRFDSLTADQQTQLRQLKGSYVLGRQMIDRSN